MSIPSEKNHSRWQLVSVALCIAFSIAHILNIHPIGDGLWFWDATEVSHGKGLYSDIHFTLQPLFVVLTSWNQALLGSSWLASKALALLQAVIYAIGVFRVAAYVPWRDALKAWLIAGVFMLTIVCDYYRFDDYHITVQCLAVWTAYLLLQAREGKEGSRNLWIAAGTGILGGLALSDRLNDGAAIITAVALCMIAMMRTRRVAAVLVLFAAAIATLLGVVRLSDPSLHSWAYYSILHVAGIKGGAGNIVSSTLLFPFTALVSFFKQWRLPAITVAVVLLYASILITGKVDGEKRSLPIRAGAGVLGALIAIWLMRLARVGAPGGALGLFLAIVALIAAAWVFVRWLRPGSGADGREMLLMLPAALLFSGGMTSGRSVLEAYPPAALFLLLLPIALPRLAGLQWTRQIAVLMCGVIALTVAFRKAEMPYSWHSYGDATMFVNRTWYQHPSRGRMYISKPQLRMMQQMCATIDQHGEKSGGLLSIPYPYPNYFCDTPPWNGYVQTWYDTTGEQTIDTLDQQLMTAPPKWIVYQREPDTLRSHEVAFNHGNPIPHRKLDALIESQIRNGQWKLVSHQRYNTADWLVIQTQ